MAGILPDDKNALGWGNSDAKSQRDKYSGDAKELINGSPLDSDDGGGLGSAGDMAKGSPAPAKGKSFKA